MKRKIIFKIILTVFTLNVFTVYSQSDNALNIPRPKTTFNRAQVVEWLNDSVFIVGRWDGSITVFREPQKNEYGPVILQATTTPSSCGIEMFEKLNDSFAISSNDNKSICVWKIDNGILNLYEILNYDLKFGVANSSFGIKIMNDLKIVVGHSSGFVSIWAFNSKKINYEISINLKSDSIPANPYNLYNIRGIEYYKEDIIILASEDGDITLLKISTGEVLTRKRYNTIAERGINSISYINGYLMLANCSVGNSDKNLWLYQINGKEINLIDSKNLIKNIEKKQVFNFDVDLFEKNNKLYFYSSTEEGLLWFGSIENNKIMIHDDEEVAQEGGACLSIAPDLNNIVVVAHSINLFPLLSEK